MEERKPTPQATADGNLLQKMEELTELPARCREDVLEKLDIFMAGIMLGYKIKESA